MMHDCKLKKKSFNIMLLLKKEQMILEISWEISFLIFCTLTHTHTHTHTHIHTHIYMQDTAGEVRMNSLSTFSYKLLHTDVQVLDNQLEPIYNSSVWTQDAF